MDAPITTLTNDSGDATVRNIVILGGGTAGWLAAVYLQRTLNGNGSQGCTITLIESSDIPTVGVGESTLASLRNTLQMCGIDENDFLLACGASFKMGIRFVNWSGRPGHEVFYHPFGTVPTVGPVSLSHYWHQRYLRGDRQLMDAACFPIVPACDARRAPKILGDGAFRGETIYAYHIDAGRFATYLRQLGKSRGVQHVVDTVVDVQQRPDGAIGHLITTNHGELHGDLFIDCSGFSGRLINQTLREPFESYADDLFCDRAIAIQVPYADETAPIDPYTQATALSAGWSWRVPLYERSGEGYVYSSASLTPDQAEAELRQHLGPAAEGIPTWHLKMRVGRTQRTWVKNCVSIGLSSGFIEPLESTSIALIELGLANLVNNFPSKHMEPGLIGKYNAIMRRYYELIRDFIILHYCTSDREDTEFWRANKHRASLPASLQARVDLYEAMLPDHDEIDMPPIYDDISYATILAGMGYIPKRPLPLLAYGDEAAADRMFTAIANEGVRLANQLPDHRRYLSLMRRPEWPLLLEQLNQRVLAGQPA
jgi:2-polyprenyl-6-methoxyphenol hydroxylase-like FAD-dependent oxidoreductase